MNIPIALFASAYDSRAATAGSVVGAGVAVVLGAVVVAGDELVVVGGAVVVVATIALSGASDSGP
jgi:hypothetical protein